MDDAAHGSQPSAVTLRPAEPTDAPAIAEIWRIGWRDGHLGLVPDELVRVRTDESFAARALRRVHDTTVAVVAGNTRARRFYARSGWADAGLFDYTAAGGDEPITVPCHRYVRALDGS